MLPSSIMNQTNRQGPMDVQIYAEGSYGWPDNAPTHHTQPRSFHVSAILFSWSIVLLPPLIAYEDVIIFWRNSIKSIILNTKILSKAHLSCRPTGSRTFAVPRVTQYSTARNRSVQKKRRRISLRLLIHSWMVVPFHLCVFTKDMLR